jgi:hypothetical protein
MLQDREALGLTLQTALSDPLSTLVTGNAGRIIEDNGWPNVETRIELGVGPRSTIRGSQVRPLEFGVSGVVGQFRTTRTIIGDPSYFVNFVWDLSKAAQLSLELDYRRTDYTQFQPDALLDADALIVATRFLWRF